MNRRILFVGLVSLSLLLCVAVFIATAQVNPPEKTRGAKPAKELTTEEIRKLTPEQLKKLIEELPAKQLWDMRLMDNLTPEQRKELNKFELRKMRGFKVVKGLEDMTPEEREAAIEAGVQRISRIVQDTTRDKGPGWDDWVTPRSDRVATLIGEPDPPRFIPVLIKLLSDRHPDVRAKAAGVLGLIPDKQNRAIGPLFAVLEKDRSPMVRLRAAGALIAMGQAEARDRTVCKALVEIAKGVGLEDWRIEDSQASRKRLTVPEDVFMKELRMIWRCNALCMLAPLRNLLSSSEIAELIVVGTSDLKEVKESWYRQKVEAAIRQLQEE